MKKIIILISLIGIKNYAQEINYTPPSPEAFKFVNDVKVDEDYTGAANVFLPLLTINNRSLNESVNISYHTAGVKVDDLSSEIGMSWLLKVGGVLTRTVYGQADELANERLNYDENTIKNYLATDCSPNDFMRRIIFQPSTSDAQKDIFRFNVSGISGSFVLDENFNPKFLQNDYNVKVNMLSNGTVVSNSHIFDGFEIIATNGTKYIFGGTDFIEQSGSTISHPPMYVPTAYYLNKTIGTNGDSVSFYYENENSISNNILKISTFTHIEGKTDPVVIPERIIVKNDIQRLIVKNKKRISQIVGNDCNCSLIFNYQNKNNSDFGKYLESIDYRINNQSFEKINFEYFFEDKGQLPIQRFFLTKINLFKKEIYDKSYSFEYNNPNNLPSRLSNAQDMLGFYNGANNPSLLPLPYHPYFTGSDYGDLHPFITQQNFGDRKPNFNLSLYGSLKKIIYPTGGSTEYEYEAPKAYDVDEVDLNSTDPLSINTFDNIYTKEILLPRLSMNQTVQINLSGGTTTINTPRYAIFKLYEYDENSINQELILEKEILTYNRPNVPAPTFTYDLAFKEGKSYRMTLAFKANYTEEVFFYGTINNIKVKAFRNYLGLRVKTRSDISENNQKIYKRYYYRPTEFYTKEEIYTADKFFIEPEKTLSSVFSGTVDGGSLTTTTYTSSNTSPYYDIKNKNRYSIISYSLGSDDFEKGGYEKHYQIDSDDAIERINPAYGSGSTSPSSPSGLGFADTDDGKMNLLGYIYNHIYFPPQSNRTEFDGQLLKIKYYEKKNGNIYKTKQEANEYLYNNNNEFCNLKISLSLDDLTEVSCNGQLNKRIGNYYIGLYKWVNVINKLNANKTIEYKNPILLKQNYASLDEYNQQEEAGEIGVEGITSTKKLFYDISNKYLLKESREITSSGETFNTHYIYPLDKGNQFLIGKNMIDTPLEVKVVKKQSENSVNGKTISKTESLYPLSQAEANIITEGLPLPYSILKQDIQSELMIPEVNYKYDNKGNVVEYTTKSGLPVTIIWGYNKSLPIAKIEGAEYRSLIELPALIEAISASNNDAQTGTDTSEQSLVSALEIFRNNSALASYQVSTYTYDPLIGVRSITPPSGIKESYIYDSANRLQKVIDVNGKVLKEMKYNYKN